MAFDARLDRTSARIRGGKGAHLTLMQSLGLPVPPGFTITTTVARAAMYNEGKLPERFARQMVEHIRLLERQTGKRFGDPSNPLLVSVRSGAEISMPGMMDTVLNLGINEEIAAGLAEGTSTAFAGDCLKRFRTMYSEIVLKNDPHAPVDATLIPSDPWQQLAYAVKAVINSWNSPRAIEYRKVAGIPNNLGTAVNVQAMVFGNRDQRSGTGVLMSRDPNTGEDRLYGEFLTGVQGEDVVSGSATPLPIDAMREWNVEVYNDLVRYARTIEEHLDAIADIEFTIEEGKLYLLQCRPAKLSDAAKATFAVHRVWKRRWTKENAISTLTREQTESLSKRPAFVFESGVMHWTFGTGIAASPGAACGVVALTSEEACAMKAEGKSVVLVRPETSPHDLAGLLASVAVVTTTGGATSHAAVVARDLGIPAVVALNVAANLTRGQPISVCGDTGRVYAGHLKVDQPKRSKEINLFLKWATPSAPPRIAFDAVNQRTNVFANLINVYLAEAMAREARGSTLELGQRRCATNMLSTLPRLSLVTSLSLSRANSDTLT